MNKQLILDPKGYFLIRIIDNEVEVGFCHYKDMVWKTSNKVIKQFSSKDKKEIINWINNNSLISKEDHMEYMKREIKRALESIKTKKEYIQD